MRNVFLRNSYRVAGLLLLGAMAACDGSQNPADQRLQRAKTGTGDIVIGAPWPWEARGSDGFYREGMNLAVEKINANGGVLGRKLRIVRVDDKESVNEGRLVAQLLANDPEVVAVIGHLQSYVTIPAATIYDLGGLVMIAPFSTSPKLTLQGFKRVFRTTFNDGQVGRQMAVFAHRHGYERVALLYLRNTYGRDLANAFEKRAHELGLNVVERQSYTPAADRMNTSFGTVLRSWRDGEFDAIFLAAAVPEAGLFIAQTRATGIDVPIFGGDAMDSISLIEMGGEATEGTIVASNFHVDDPRPVVQHFVQAFNARTGQMPNRGAAAGYDAVRMLAHAIEQAGSTVPEEVTQALRTMAPWEGVTGVMAFDEKGDLSDGILIAKVVRNGKLEYLEALTSRIETPQTEANLVAITP